ncbi:MAG: diaminopimelate decarboxylase, partial [Candidatus Kapabacteria bacterium]|nr:diaminopimelate decarboxylase [Candidatus Kapabacteria bacterium]
MDLLNGRYHIGGIAVDELCTIAGAPVYVYDTAIMARQVERLRSAFPAVKLRIMYACKALTNVSVLKVMRGLGTGLDTVSLQEVELGLHAGFAPEEILYTPNMVSFEELRTAVNLGVHINIDTISVLERFGHEFGSRVPVCLRVNPHIMAGGNERISTGHIDSKFGISIHQMRHVQRIVATHGIHVNGLHMHTGSDIVDADVFLQGAEILFETAEMFPELTFVDFGSGFKVPYKPDDISTDIEDLGAKLSARIAEFNAGRATPIEVWFEPGKFL